MSCEHRQITLGLPALEEILEDVKKEEWTGFKGIMPFLEPCTVCGVKL